MTLSFILNKYSVQLNLGYIIYKLREPTDWDKVNCCERFHGPNLAFQLIDKTARV